MLPPPRHRQRVAAPIDPGYLFWVISDVHAMAGDGTFARRCERIGENFIPAMQRIHARHSTDVLAGILLIGDLTQASSRADFKSFTQHVLTPFKAADRAPKRVFAVPGNHDHLREVIPHNAMSGKRHLHPKKITRPTDREDLVGKPANWENAIGCRFFTYHEWCSANSDSKPEMTAGPWQAQVSPPIDHVGGPDFEVQVGGVNSAIASDGKGEATDNRLWVHDQQVFRALSERKSGRVNLLLMHHSPDEHLVNDGDAQQMLYRRADIILHGHKHTREIRPAAGDRPLIVRVPSFGNPAIGKKGSFNYRDGCAVVRLLRDRAQVYFLSQRPPVNDQPMVVDHLLDADGDPKPDHELPYRKDVP